MGEEGEPDFSRIGSFLQAEQAFFPKASRIAVFSEPFPLTPRHDSLKKHVKVKNITFFQWEIKSNLFKRMMNIFRKLFFVKKGMPHLEHFFTDILF